MPQNAISDLKDKYTSGTQETEGLGNELRARADMSKGLEGTTAAPTPAAPKAPEKIAGSKPVRGPFGSQRGEKRIDVSDMVKPLGSTPVYDRGGKVNIHDGKHQAAILKQGERVLTEKQNKEYEKDNPAENAMEAKIYDKGGKVPTPYDMIAKPKSAAEPADLDPKNGTSTSTGGATATGNSGAATGGAVTVTISGSSSTKTSTETSTETATSTGTGAGKGAKGSGKGAKGAAKGVGEADQDADTGDKRPHVYNITVNSTGQSGAVGKGDSDDTPVYDNGGKVEGAKMATPYDLITGGSKGKAPKKEIKEMVHTKSHNGKHIVTHKHHSPAHHPDEIHAFNNMDEVKDHMDQHDAGADGAAPMTASPSPEAAPAAPAAGGAAPAAPAAM